MRIGLVEDNELLRDMLCSALEDEGFDVGAAADADELATLMASAVFDAYVIDLNLPGEDGLSISRRLKAIQPDGFIIMATARERISDRVAGYEYGADIYMTKPVHVRELVAALRGHALKRQQLGAVDQGLIFDTRQLLLTLNDQSCRLSPTEAIVLKAMVMAPSQRVEYWQFFDLLDKAPTEANKRVLEVHVVNIRKKLAQLGCEARVIQSIRGQGYCLLCRVRLADQ